MQWVKSRTYECPPNKEFDGVRMVTHRLRDDGAILIVKARHTNRKKVEDFLAEMIDESSPWTEIDEGTFDADFERQMKENNGTEIKEEVNDAAIQK